MEAHGMHLPKLKLPKPFNNNRKWKHQGASD